MTASIILPVAPQRSTASQPAPEPPESDACLGGGLLLRLLQRKGHRKIPAAQRLCPSGEVVDFSQAGVAPRIGAIEQDDLISLIQHNVTGLGRGLRILRGQTLFKRSHLFKAAVSRLNVAATYNLIFNASLMVEAGLGYAVCLDKLINTSGASRLCFLPLRPEIVITPSIVWKRYQVFSKASERFLQELTSVMDLPQK